MPGSLLNDLESSTRLCKPGTERMPQIMATPFSQTLVCKVREELTDQLTLPIGVC